MERRSRRPCSGLGLSSVKSGARPAMASLRVSRIPGGDHGLVEPQDPGVAAAADGGIPISCIMTSASTHDSQVAIPLGTLTAGRVENLYDLMDAAYDSIEIWAHSILLGHKPIVDVNPRRSVDMQKALKQEKKARRTLGLVFPEERRYVVRSGSERINGRLKDEFGGRHVRVRGYDKVLAHLMFGMTVLTASQLMRLIVPPI